MIEIALGHLLAALVAAPIAAAWQARDRRRGRRGWPLLRPVLLFLAAWPVVAFLLLYLAGARGFQLFGGIVPRVETREPVVALTFDDGPAPGPTERVLAMLEAEGARATFFLTGAELERHPDLGRRIAAAGHELGNHSYSHPRMLGKSLEFVREEVESTDRLIREAGHAGPIHFRPPYGKKLLVLPFYLARAGRKTITWDVEPESHGDVVSDARAIEEHVLERARPGSIILLHVMYPAREPSLQAVPGIVRGLREKGLRLVTVSELLSLAGRR